MGRNFADTLFSTCNLFLTLFLFIPNLHFHKTLLQFYHFWETFPELTLFLSSDHIYSVLPSWYLMVPTLTCDINCRMMMMTLMLVVVMVIRQLDILCICFIFPGYNIFEGKDIFIYTFWIPSQNLDSSVCVVGIQ